MRLAPLLLTGLGALLAARATQAQLPSGTVLAHHETQLGVDGFIEGVDDGESFGTAVAWLDDLDGDGSHDLLVGAPRSNDDDTSSADRGAVWTMSQLQEPATATARKVSESTPLLGAALAVQARFGTGVCLGDDYDGDGVRELLVTAPGDEQAGPDAGALFVVRRDGRGNVLGYSLLLPGSPLLPFGNGEGGQFGSSVCTLGDLDGNGYSEVAVGETAYEVIVPKLGLPRTYGAVRILFPGPGAVLEHAVTITTGFGGFTGQLDHGDLFGSSVAAVGDLDGDGVGELAVGAVSDDDGGSARGATWILFLQADGQVKAQAKISATQGGFAGPLDDQDGFGRSLAPLGDLDDDGTLDLAVGAASDDDGGNGCGAVWLLRLQAGGSVASATKLSATASAALADLQDDEGFGASLARVPELREGWLAVGSSRKLHPAQLLGEGAVRLLRLDGDGSIAEVRLYHVGNTPALEGTVPGNLGHAVAASWDSEGDGLPDLVYLSGGKAGRMELHADGTLVAAPGLIQPAAGPPWDLPSLQSVTLVGDVDHDGTPDAAVVSFPEQLNVLLLEPDGTIGSSVELSAGSGGLPPGIGSDVDFGHALCPLGDIDGDGTPDLAVGAPGDDGSPMAPKLDTGAVWVVFLKPDGTAHGARKIGSAELGLAGAPGPGQRFGSALANLGDLDHDGVTDLAVGAPALDASGGPLGGAWILFLGPGGVVRDIQLIPVDPAGLAGPTTAGFGVALATLRDLDGDGVPELAGSQPLAPLGVLWILRLASSGQVKSVQLNLGYELGFALGTALAPTSLSGSAGGQSGQWLVIGRQGAPGSFVSVLLAKDP